MPEGKAVTDRSVAIQFTVLTFAIAYGVSGALIVLGQVGYSVHNWVHSPQQFAMDAPFAIYILSPAIASYVVLRKNRAVANLKEWLSTVFHAKNNIFLYVYVVAVLGMYFVIHLVVSGRTDIPLPLYMVFLSLPGNLIIGGLEESGWMYILQPALEKKCGFVRSAAFFGVVWTFWHIPLFFIPGTNHSGGLIDFWMFTVQVIAFRFLFGAIYTISGQGRVFMCVLCHTVFNAASPVFGVPPATWGGTIAANAAVVLLSLVTVAVHDKRTRHKG